MKTRNLGSYLPAKPVQFLSLDETIAIHERLVERFGGTSGIRDHGLLESALYRPQTGYYECLDEMAAALFESLWINHPFIDGNKRVAYFATDVFLRLNGWKLQVEADDAHDFLMKRYSSGTCNYEHLLPWIQSLLVKRNV